MNLTATKFSRGTASNQACHDWVGYFLSMPTTHTLPPPPPHRLPTKTLASKIKPAYTQEIDESAAKGDETRHRRRVSHRRPSLYPSISVSIPLVVFFIGLSMCHTWATDRFAHVKPLTGPFTRSNRIRGPILYTTVGTMSDGTSTLRT